MTKKQLYESIMRNVSYEVKKALNESFEFEPAEALNAFIAAFNDERIAKVVGNVDCQDINELVKAVAKMAVNELPEKAPLRISSVKSLSAYVLVKHFNDAAIKEITEMGKAELDDLANCVCQDVLNVEPADNDNDDLEAKPQYNQQMNRNLPAPTQRQLPECNRQQKTNECNCGGNKQPVKECGNATNESINYRRRRRIY